MRVGENRGIEGVMPRFAVLLLMYASVWYACTSGAVAAASTLKVAACQTYEPYVVGRDAQLTGFDIQFWGLVYDEMKQVANMNRDTTVLTLLGDAAPPISVMTRENLLQAVKDGTVDVGMCGFQIDSQDHMMLDYSYPVIKTGFRGIIKKMMKSVTVTSMAKVAWESMFRGISPSAVFAMLILLMFSVCFSNIIYFLERNENPLISKTYCWGVFDAWWMIIVTALTVGYGDKVPTTFFGKMFMIVWMFIGTYCMGLFVASVTSEFLAPGNNQDSLAKLTSITELDIKLSVGTADSAAYAFMLKTLPGITIAQFSNTRALMKAVADDIIGEFVKNLEKLQCPVSFIKDIYRLNVAVGEQWNTRWLMEFDEEFKTAELMPIADTFVSRPSGLVVSRQKVLGGGSSSHTLLHSLNQAIMNVAFVEGDNRLKSISDVWLLKHSPRIKTSYADVLNQTLTFWNKVYVVGLAVVLFMWCGVVVVHYRREIAHRRFRAGLMVAMGLHRGRFSQAELTKAVTKFFHGMDKDGSGTIDAQELVDELSARGMLMEDAAIAIIFAEGDEHFRESEHWQNVLQNSSRDVEKRRFPHKQIDEAMFQKICLELVLKETQSSLTDPLQQVHLENAMVHIMDRFLSIQKEIQSLQQQRPPSENLHANNAKISSSEVSSEAKQYVTVSKGEDDNKMTKQSQSSSVHANSFTPPITSSDITLHSNPTIFLNDRQNGDPGKHVHQASGGEGELGGDLDNDHPFATPNREVRGDVHMRRQRPSSSHNGHNMHQQRQSESHRISLYEPPHDYMERPISAAVYRHVPYKDSPSSFNTNPRPYFDDPSKVSVRSGTITLVNNRVKAEHSVELKDRLEYHGRRNGWEGEEGDTMGGRREGRRSHGNSQHSPSGSGRELGGKPEGDIRAQPAFQDHNVSLNVWDRSERDLDAVKGEESNQLSNASGDFTQNRTRLNPLNPATNPRRASLECAGGDGSGDVRFDIH